MLVNFLGTPSGVGTEALDELREERLLWAADQGEQIEADAEVMMQQKSCTRSAALKAITIGYSRHYARGERSFRQQVLRARLDREPVETPEDFTDEQWENLTTQ